jgi:hypothetical protein
VERGQSKNLGYKLKGMNCPIISESKVIPIQLDRRREEMFESLMIWKSSIDSSSLMMNESESTPCSSPETAQLTY